MIIRTDVFYNFLMSNYDIFKEQDETTLKQAWSLYKNFCDEGRYDWRLNMGKFRDELRNYFATSQSAAESRAFRSGTCTQASGRTS